MKLNKLRYVLSKGFISLCADNIEAMGMERVIRMAERRYMFANPKADEVEIDESDVNRALSIAKNKDARYDRIANLYSWLARNISGVRNTAALNRDVMKSLWMSYRGYITANALEELWVVTKVYDNGTDLEVEFSEVCALIANSEV
ncbi:hypothetical protein RAY_136 [Erwinia phage vB_EamM_RAY]|uniref:Uncharacterized protein n=5 Tax=Agricanvirus TaxID=1984776 RepID=A0A173GE59_9CAUD|nr:hypothetical protein FDH97_gp141 [Erwinia phage vB_EamM_Deimos-Minion]YP_009605603.1 hypothetical protein FDH98_gp136 [Erwinia phage vB_EamM_RAY]YP_009605923.1 hypothetical protein FDH99_gp139 [Erwinia phage vB_EamM_Simmy50]AUG86565.1 hypothetical protein MADMEL_137 [Erwinia phage vB_EamM_MadMel]AUG86889.1 hypothetical protein MORTIMER_140 [Erwinia phage vB_EamM_Mortimer]ANH51601.1 hypothetical protein SIMMY50_139 [Erwinia phage vB_EamM_Simmy50]ANH51917.1 hypothetical protein RAY_136 [Erwi